MRNPVRNMLRLRVPHLQALILGLVLLPACGGGSGGLPPQPAPDPTILDGLSGHVHMPGTDLGRIVEQEPNDTAAQAFDLAPIWARSTIEVTGELGTTAAWFARVDPADVLRVVSLAAQQIDLQLTFAETDPVDGTPNLVSATVTDVELGTVVATTTPGAQPLALSFEARADAPYDVTVTIASGHAWYVVQLIGSDLPQAPLPKPAATSTAGVASAPLAVAHAKPVVGSAACAGSHVLVRFAEGCDPATFCAGHSLTLGRRLGTGSYLVEFPCSAGEDGAAKARRLVAELGALPGVLAAEPDWVLKAQGEANDRFFNRQWNLRMVGAPSAWDILDQEPPLVAPGPPVVVGVLDSGIIAHPDLAGQTVPGYDFISDPARAGDGDGRDSDPTDTGDRGDGSGLSIWHGTHVASIIAARRNDGVGMAGIASGCKLMILRALGEGGGLVSDAVDAILYSAGLAAAPDGSVRQTPLPILNMSLGSAQDSANLRDACERASNNGVLLVAAVGNAGTGVFYPAAYPTVYAVAAVGGDSVTTAYSNFGDEVDIAAPGGSVLGDPWNDGWHDGVFGAVLDETVEPAAYSHAYIVGTSQAAPHVAAAAAILLSLDPSLSSNELKQLLNGSALDLGVPGRDITYGSGLLQIHEAVRAVLEGLGSPRSDDPYLSIPTRSVEFHSFDTRVDLSLTNGGGGRLNLFTAVATTDDGAPWLSGALIADANPSSPINSKALTVEVDRTLVPMAPGRYSGSILLGNSSGMFGSVRVVMYVQQRSRAGQVLPVTAIEISTAIARRMALAAPDRGYRYWFRGLPPGDYRLRAGEDVDGNGIFCESFEACGWFGGPEEIDALPVTFAVEEPALKGLGIDLFPPP